MEREVRAVIRGIWKNHPEGVSTFGPCANGCQTSARGSGECAECYEEELAKLTSIPLAEEYHELVRRIRRMEAILLEEAGYK